MPELPEVERARRLAERWSAGKRIEMVAVVDDRIVYEGVTPRRFAARLRGRRIEAVRRWGKHIWMELDRRPWPSLHFGMTGFLKYFKKAEQEPEHERLALHLVNGYHLAYDNQRLLGRVFLAGDRERFIEERELGPDALGVDFDTFASILNRGRGSVKTTLMNQKMLAGLGNIYTDEILFQARLHPKSEVGTLSRGDIRTLFERMRTVLTRAIGVQADPGRMPGDWLLPAREEGANCPGCGGKVEKITLSGRSAYFCPACQPGPGRSQPE